jgi:hypothetical protein
MKVILTILTVFVAASFQAPPSMLIKPGQEADGLRLNKTFVQTAFTKYGKYTGFTQGIACGDQDYYTNRYTFSKQSITIISETSANEDQKSESIAKIGISYPCKAETEEGISLISDNCDKVIKVYGKPEDTDTSKTFIDIHYRLRGISFRCDRVTKNIQKIEIYLSGMTPDFSY